MTEEPKNRIDGSAEPNSSRRRRHSRYPFTATVETVEPKSKMRIQGRTSDLSRGGCYVDTMNCFPPGSIVKMRLTKEMRSFETQAEVIYSLHGMGMGVKFKEAEPEHLRTLEEWVAELSGEPLPGSELPQSSEQSGAQPRPGTEEHLVLNELVMELMKQGVLSSVKCQAMLQKLNR